MRQTFDIGQCLTCAVQYLASEMLSKGLTFSFDMRGPRLLIEDAEEGFSRTFHRLVKGGLDILQSGTLIIEADTDATGRFLLRVGGLGRLADAVAISQVLVRLELPSKPDTTASHQLASGVCHITGATVDVVADQRDGLLIEAAFCELPVIFRPSPSCARGARAWVVGPGPGPSSIAARLARLGWDARAFETLTGLEDAVALLPEAPPHLVIGIEGCPRQPDAINPGWMSLAWPTWTRLILGVVRGSPTLRERRAAIKPWDVWPIPLGPVELERLTAEHQFGFDASTLSDVRTAASTRPRLLVVDDNPTNRLLARAAARLWGYEPILATNGRQALNACLQVAPQAVLMDVNMPVMDGLAATRVLRAWQTSGRLPPFPILAVTADASEETGQACLEAGMEVVLHKPLVIDEVAAALRQLCPHAPMT